LASFQPIPEANLKLSKWQPKNKKTKCPTSANGWLRSANAPLMMPNERRI
jgi:hypothetical protein